MWMGPRLWLLLITILENKHLTLGDLPSWLFSLPMWRRYVRLMRTGMRRKYHGWQTRLRNIPWWSGRRRANWHMLPVPWYEHRRPSKKSGFSISSGLAAMKNNCWLRRPVLIGWKLMWLSPRIRWWKLNSYFVYPARNIERQWINQIHWTFSSLMSSFLCASCTQSCLRPKHAYLTMPNEYLLRSVPG